MNIFDYVYNHGQWSEGGTAPLSGFGSTVANSRPVLEALTNASPSSICDIGCGDLTFMRDFLTENQGKFSYTGIDVSHVALALARKPSIPGTVFLFGDVTHPDFEAHAEVIVIKDILFHLETWQLARALKALERSTYKYLITNTDKGASDDRVLNHAMWQGADLEGELFGPYLAKLGKIVAREPRPAHGEFLFIER